jgi:hypothetical protein
MNKNETVALMAATIYAAESSNEATTDIEALVERVAAQAWALYDAVERVSVERYS